MPSQTVIVGRPAVERNLSIRILFIESALTFLLIESDAHMRVEGTEETKRELNGAGMRRISELFTAALGPIYAPKGSA